ncbi:MAG: ATPase, T2SS/T4P/T4SS family [Vicinamibacterales bacterium]
MNLPELLRATLDLGKLGPPPVHRIATAGQCRRRPAPARPAGPDAAGRDQGPRLQRPDRRPRRRSSRRPGNSTSRSACAASAASSATSSASRARWSSVFPPHPGEDRTLDELGMPWCLGPGRSLRPRAGDGPTGSGKSTTLARGHRPDQRRQTGAHPDDRGPDQYLHLQDRAGRPAQTRFRRRASLALRAALREDPDVVLVGEMRDLETMEAAMKLAETGHLTLGTLHTNSAAQTVTRIIDAFPAHQQAQIRTQLSLVLEGIVTQTLLPKAGGAGRVAALEILVATPAIRNLIRDDKIHQIYGTMQAGQEKLGMQTMNQSLARLVERRVITRETAANVSANRDELFMILERGTQHAAPPASIAARRPLRQEAR